MKVDKAITKEGEVIVKVGDIFKLKDEDGVLECVGIEVPTRPLAEPWVRAYKLEGTPGRYRRGPFRSPALSRVERVLDE